MNRREFITLLGGAAAMAARGARAATRCSTAGLNWYEQENSDVQPFWN
jgi:hypothetical protein